METRYLPDPTGCKSLDTNGLRKTFLIENLFRPDAINMVYSNIDRAIVGSAVPTKDSLKLEAGKELAANYFAERREIGVINIGDNGSISVDGKVFPLENCEFLYIGKESKEIIFSSDSIASPAQFYFLSYPAHKVYPTLKGTLAEADKSKLGSVAESNVRTINRVIHTKGIKSCQVVMGLTVLEEGSIWNTMTPHTHERRSEVYLYFDIPKDALVFHFMGKPEETRHIVIRDRQAVLSPTWSIHSGAGTKCYKFIWGMGGENQEFGDMDSVSIDSIF